MRNKKKAAFALTVFTTASLCFQPTSAWAEKIKIQDSVTGEIMIYDTETKKIVKENEPNVLSSPSQPNPEKLPELPGLFYSDIPIAVDRKSVV